MDSNVDFAVAIDSINRKIADLNLKIIECRTQELENELDKLLEIREEIYKGNIILIKKVVNNEI